MPSRPSKEGPVCVCVCLCVCVCVCGGRQGLAGAPPHLFAARCAATRDISNNEPSRLTFSPPATDHSSKSQTCFLQIPAHCVYLSFKECVLCLCACKSLQDA